MNYMQIILNVFAHQSHMHIVHIYTFTHHFSRNDKNQVEHIITWIMCRHRISLHITTLGFMPFSLHIMTSFHLYLKRGMPLFYKNSYLWSIVWYVHTIWPTNFRVHIKWIIIEVNIWLAKRERERQWQMFVWLLVKTHSHGMSKFKINNIS